MRIDAINKMNQLYQATKPKKANETGSAKTSEKYEVSRSGKDYQTAKAAIKDAPDIREDKVAGIKDALVPERTMCLHRRLQIRWLANTLIPFYKWKEARYG